MEDTAAFGSGLLKRRQDLNTPESVGAPKISYLAVFGVEKVSPGRRDIVR